jgi:hypothetical protein
MFTFFTEDIKAWKEEQAAHYKAHPYKDPKHAALQQKIQESIRMVHLLVQLRT